MIAAEHKIGKSTFGASCPKPLFIQTEAGLEGIEVNAFPLVNTFEEFELQLDAVERLENGMFRTLVIDSVDWLERLIHRKVCQTHKVNDIAQIGFGKGHVAAETIWGEVLDRLTLINRDKKLMIVLLAHVIIQKFEDPERDGYDRIIPDLHKKSVNLLCEWVDILGYAALKIATVSKNDGPIKAKTTGERVLHLTPRGGYMAGNRYGLPDTVAFEWKAIAEQLKLKGKAGAVKQEVKKQAVQSDQPEVITVGVN